MNTRVSHPRPEPSRSGRLPDPRSARGAVAISREDLGQDPLCQDRRRLGGGVSGFPDPIR